MGALGVPGVAPELNKPQKKVVNERSASKINKQPPALNERSARASEASSARGAIRRSQVIFGRSRGRGGNQKVQKMGPKWVVRQREVF